MSRGWAIVIIMTVMVMIFWSGLQIYSIFTNKEDEVQVIQVTPIDRVLNVEVVEFVKKNDSLVPVKNDDIQPKN